MNTVIADITNELQKIYSKLNEKYYDGKLPDVIISVQASNRNKYYGWFGKNKWFKKSNADIKFVDYDEIKNPLINLHEINISAEHLDRSIEELVGTLNHEMVHLYCTINNIKDTSNNCVYHNKKFKEEAEKRGLIIEHAKTIGWSKTSITSEFYDFIKTIGINLSAFDFCRNKSVKKSVAAEKIPTTTYKCSNCESVVRGNVGLNVICGDCKIEMVSKK
jgi:hypothetical protein